MQLKKDIEYYSSSETINYFEDSDLEWPLIKGSNRKLIVACDICYYPITFEEHVIDEIRNENNISFAIVIPIKKLFKKVGICCDDPLEQWQTEVYCPNCGIVLSFLNSHQNDLSVTNFAKITNYTCFDVQIVILWTHPLFRGSEAEAYSRFKQMQEL